MWYLVDPIITSLVTKSVIYSFDSTVIEIIVSNPIGRHIVYC